MSNDTHDVDVFLRGYPQDHSHRFDWPLRQVPASHHTILPRVGDYGQTLCQSNNVQLHEALLTPDYLQNILQRYMDYTESHAGSCLFDTFLRHVLSIQNQLI